MAGSYKVAVEKDYLVFAAGHFITYDGECEALHGHNYRVRVELEGTLDENAYVFDFVTLKRIMRRLVDELDHRMLLPRDNPLLTLEEAGKGIRVRYRDREYLFPRSDVVLLPIPNTTAEMLARHLAGRLKQELAGMGIANVSDSVYRSARQPPPPPPVLRPSGSVPPKVRLGSPPPPPNLGEGDGGRGPTPAAETSGNRPNISAITIEVEESFGQSAWYREELPNSWRIDGEGSLRKS